jgi:hypothetical protein
VRYEIVARAGLRPAAERDSAHPRDEPA